jgi:hypothetical protein
VLRGALRRFSAIVAVSVAAGAIVGGLLALLLGLEIRRALAVGFYLCGVALCGLAFLLSMRPPVRGEGSAGFIGIARWAGGRVRWASREEQEDAINAPALMLTVGVIVILCGVGVDNRH